MLIQPGEWRERLRIAQKGIRGIWGHTKMGAAEGIYDRKNGFWGFPQTRPLYLQIGERAEIEWVRGRKLEGIWVKPRHPPTWVIWVERNSITCLPLAYTKHGAGAMPGWDRLQSPPLASQQEVATSGWATAHTKITTKSRGVQEFWSIGHIAAPASLRRELGW